MIDIIFEFKVLLEGSQEGITGGPFIVFRQKSIDVFTYIDDDL